MTSKRTRWSKLVSMPSKINIQGGNHKDILGCDEVQVSVIPCNRTMQYAVVFVETPCGCPAQVVHLLHECPLTQYLQEDQ